MSFTKARSALITFSIVSIILTISFGIIAYGKGYRVDIGKRKVSPTGLIAAHSDPDGARVLVNGILKSATNNSFNVEPGWYTVRIVKEGFAPWEKQLRVQGEVAVRADAFLFPTNPSLSPLTTTGVINPTLSPDGSKVAYIIPKEKNENDHTVSKAGLWIFELSDGPLGRNRDPQQIGAFADLDWTNATIVWSPDSRDILVRTADATKLYVLSKPMLPTEPGTTLPTLLNGWANDQETKNNQKLAGFPQEIIDTATSSAKILSFSPDETKLLYEATASATLPNIIKPPLIGANPTNEQRSIQKGKLYVYDVKEDKNFFLLDSKELMSNPSDASKNKNADPSSTENFNPAASALVWFPTSRHILLSQKGKIDIMEYDRTNWITLYAGPFEPGFLAPWPGGNRLVIVTNLNPGTSNLPNLYTVNLR